MDAVSYLLENIDYEKLLNHYGFDDAKHSGNYIRCSCKIHGGDNPNAFVLNEDNGLWFCHTGSCGGGDSITLVEKMDNLNFIDAIKKLAEIMGLDINNMEIKKRSEKHMKELIIFMKIIKSRRKKNKVQEDYSLPDGLKSVTSFRSFTPNTLKHFNLKFLKEIKLKSRSDKEYPMKDRLLIPIYSATGHLIAYALRRTRASDQPKWFYQPNEFEAGNVLYNYDECADSDVVVVVEGIFDVWAYHEIGIKAVATFGAHLTDEQAKLLIRLGCDIALSYDNDKAGGIATVKAIDKLRNKANLFLVPFKQDDDPEKIERSELLNAYTNRRRIY